MKEGKGIKSTHRRAPLSATTYHNINNQIKIPSNNFCYSYIRFIF